MRTSRVLLGNTPPAPWSLEMLPYRIRNMIDQKNPGIDEFGPRYWTGVVLHKKMQKTASVKVDHYSPHPKYKKTMLRTKKYLVHDPDDSCVPGDKILFEKSRPYSATKHWIVRHVLRRSKTAEFVLANPEVTALTQKSERRKREESEAVSGRT